MARAAAQHAKRDPRTARLRSNHPVGIPLTLPPPLLNRSKVPMNNIDDEGCALEMLLNETLITPVKEAIEVQVGSRVHMRERSSQLHVAVRCRT